MYKYSKLAEKTLNIVTMAIVTTAIVTGTVNAASLNATVLNNRSKPIVDAVISLMPSSHENLLLPIERPKAEMDQWQKQYVPYDLPILVGTEIRFPNKDNIKHHVYSFSSVKRFELKLYAGVNTKPVVFDKPGVVVLGCNIHDWMLGYIYVLDTAYFAKTDERGNAQIKNLPDGIYVVSIWHPRLRGKPEKYDQEITLRGEQTAATTFEITLKRERRRRRPPDFEEEDY